MAEKQASSYWSKYWPLLIPIIVGLMFIWGKGGITPPPMKQTSPERIPIKAPVQGVRVPPGSLEKEKRDLPTIEP